MQIIKSLLNPLFIFSCVLLITFLCFSPSLKNQFVSWDDDVHFLENRDVRSLSLDNVRHIFSQTINYIYLPLSTLSFSLEYKLFGYNPFVSHLINLILHLGVVALIFLLAPEFGFSFVAAGFAALLFGIHPMHVEAVAWATSRKEVLYSLFYFMAILNYVKYIRTEGKGWLVSVFCCSFLSVLAKPSALSLPFILLLIDWYERRDKSLWIILKEKIYLALFIFPIVWMTFVAVSHPSPDRAPGSVLIWLWSFTSYIEKFFFPDTFLIFYMLPEPISMATPEYLKTLLILFCILGVIYLLRRSRLFIFAMAFYFISIFMFLRVDNYRALNISDRYMYLPSAGMCLWVGVTCDHILRQFRGKSIARISFAVLMVCFFSFLGIRTWQQCKVWRDSLTLWTFQFQGSDTKTALLYSKLASALTDQKEFLTILDHYAGEKRLMAREMKDLELHILSKEESDTFNRVMDLYEKGLVLQPDMSWSYFHLGTIFKRMNEDTLAIENFSEAIKLKATMAEAYYQLGEIYFKAGKFDDMNLTYLKIAEIGKKEKRILEDILRIYEQDILTSGPIPLLIKGREVIKGFYQNRLGETK